jgi:hypothetical protein
MDHLQQNLEALITEHDALNIEPRWDVFTLEAKCMEERFTFKDGVIKNEVCHSHAAQEFVYISC